MKVPISSPAGFLADVGRESGSAGPRLAVIVQIPDGAASVRFPISLAGLIVDGGFWMGFVMRALISSISHAITFGLIWFTLIVALNATPWIRGSDGWQIQQIRQSKEGHIP